MAYNKNAYAYYNRYRRQRNDSPRNWPCEPGQDVVVIALPVRTDKLAACESAQPISLRRLRECYVNWVNCSGLTRNGYTETGRGGSDLDGANLRVEGSNDTHIYTQFALEGGLEGTTTTGLTFRPNLSVGVTRLLTDEVPTTTAAFIAGHDEAGTFTVTGDLERTYLDATLGLDVITDSELVISLNAYGRKSSSPKTQGGTLKFSFPF